MGHLAEGFEPGAVVRCAAQLDRGVTLLGQ
jgi:hypothetical protein